MKKISTVVLSAILAVSTLAGCSKPASKPVEKKDPVTIKWVTWENAYMAHELAAKFTERHPEIKVEIMHAGWFGNEDLAKKAAEGDMPDVYAVENPFIPIQNKWILDLKPYLDKEKDKKFYDNLVATGTYDGKVVMLPSYIFGYGVYLNKSLLKANNIEVPSANWTIDEFTNILDKTTKGQTIGTNIYLEFMKHIPPQLNPKLGWGVWDGKGYDTGAEWQYAANLSKSIVDKNESLWAMLDKMPDPGAYADGSAEKTKADNDRKAFLKEKFGSESDWDLFLKGNVAAWFDFTWGMGFSKDPKFAGYEWDFYPMPVKNKGDVARPGLVADSLAISSNSKHPDEAWQFLKYISFSSEAFDDRCAIIDSYDKAKAQAKYPDIPADQFSDNLSFDHMPAVNDQAVRDKWLAYTKAIPGMANIINNIGKGYVDGFKFVPDFDTAYHKTIEKAFKEQVLTGQKTPADIAAEVKQKADAITNDAIAKMKQ